MRLRKEERKRKSRAIRSLAILLLEVAVYSLLVAGYLIVALRALRPFLLQAFEHRRVLYAILAVVLMLGQGFLLELLTTLLVGLFERARRTEEVSTPGFGG